MPGPRRMRGTLGRDEIVRTALKFAESDGLEKLSLHKVAAEVGVKTMSLYNYVTDKEDLLNAMADAVMAGVEIPDVDAMSWEDAIRALAHAFRDGALKYPHAAPLLLVRRLNTPSILPMVDAALRVSRRSGLDPKAAVHVLRAYIALMVGSLLREVGMTDPEGTAPTPVVTSNQGALLETTYPAVAEAASELAVLDHQQELDFSIQLLMNGALRLMESDQ